MFSLKNILSFSSIFLSSFLAYALGSPYFLVPILVILSHEFGHYFVAKSVGSRLVEPPVILPTFPLFLGITRVPDISDLYYSYLIAYAGPFFGSVTSLSFIFSSLLIFDLNLLVISSFSFLFEFLSFFVSSDARKASNWIKNKE